MASYLLRFLIMVKYILRVRCAARRRAILAHWCWFLLLIAAAQLAHAGLEDRQHWNLPSQELSEALIAIGAESEISIIFPSNLTNNLTAPILQGVYSPRQALDILLQGQQLQWQALNARVVAISAQPLNIVTESIFIPTPMSEVLVIGKRITGSRLKRLDYEGSSPVDIISSPELAASGVQTVSDYLKFIPAVSGNSTSTSVSNGSDGTATITLRGLSASNTLVLINGRRTSNSGMAGDSVDLNSIPLVAVERIEVLKDGASAIYGSDAIAGVVNVILKNEFDGIAFEQYFGQTSHHDLKTSNTGFVVGTSTENSNLVMIASHYDQEGIFSRDRDLSANADGRKYGGIDKRSSATPFTRIGLPNDDVVMLQGPNADSSMTSNYRLATDEDLYNFFETTSSVSPSKRSGLYLNAEYFFNNGWFDGKLFDDGVLLTAQTSIVESEASVTFAPYPLFVAYEKDPLVVGANNPYNPFGVELSDLRRRLVELGPRVQYTKDRTLRSNIEIKQQNDNYNWDLGLNWNRTIAHMDFRGVIDLENTANALGDQCASIVGCVALNLFGPPGAITQDQLDYIRAQGESKGHSKMYELLSNFDTSVDNFLPAPIGLAAGVSLRKETAKLDPKRIPSVDELPHINGQRRIWEAYFETTLPLLQYLPGIYHLELELASRYSHYSDFGETNNPKYGIRYRPIKDILIRGTSSHGFRAPSLHQLVGDDLLSFDVLFDPCSQPENIGVLVGCTQLSIEPLRQVATYKGGNRELDPESSTTHTIGFVWTPEVWQNFYFSVDWFSIEQQDIIDARAQYIINQNAKFGKFDDRVVRDGGGNLVSVYASNVNIGEATIEGIDATIKYRLTDTDWGNFVFSINGSNLRHYQQRLDPTSVKKELAGSFADLASEGAGALPEWKFNGGVSWSNKTWELNYNVVFISELDEIIPYTDMPRDINSWTTQNVQVNYTTGRFDNIRLSAGIDNVFDKMPPFAASAFNDNFDQRTYELKGRNWYAQLKYHF